jgi:hypothetical protein
MVGKVNGKSPQPVQAAETTEVNISEKQTKTSSELHKGDSESSLIKASASQISTQKAEQSLGGLARQAGLFNYVLPQNSTKVAGPDGVTTMAVGEEDGDKPKLPADLSTTVAGGVHRMDISPLPKLDGGEKPKGPKLPLPDLPTTPGGGLTTMAVGEEDGEQPRLPKLPDLPTTPGGFTTMAVGEEDGEQQRLPKLPDLPIIRPGVTVGISEDDAGFDPTKPTVGSGYTPDPGVTVGISEDDGGF